MDRMENAAVTQTFALIDVSNSIRHIVRSSRRGDAAHYGDWCIGTARDMLQCCEHFGHLPAFGLWNVSHAVLARALAGHYARLGMRAIELDSNLQWNDRAWVFIARQSAPDEAGA